MRRRRLLWLLLAVPFVLEWLDARLAPCQYGELPKWVRS